jgi:hypothetical protein
MHLYWSLQRSRPTKPFCEEHVFHRSPIRHATECLSALILVVDAFECLRVFGCRRCSHLCSARRDANDPASNLMARSNACCAHDGKRCQLTDTLPRTDPQLFCPPGGTARTHSSRASASALLSITDVSRWVRERQKGVSTGPSSSSRIPVSLTAGWLSEYAGHHSILRRANPLSRV